MNKNNKKGPVSISIDPDIKVAILSHAAENERSFTGELLFAWKKMMKEEKCKK